MSPKRAVVAALAFVLLAAVPAGGASPTYVTHNCQGTKIEPQMIMFACGDGGYYVDHLQWSGWFRKSATATGVYHMNDCDPSCAGGTFHTRRGTLTLRYRQWCPEVGKHVFRRAFFTYEEPWRGEDHGSFHIYCPL